MSEPAEPIDRVLELVEEAARRDGFSALNEAALLRLRHPSPGTRHLTRHLSETDDRVIAYGQLAESPSGATDAALVVHPEHRRLGLGTAILTEMLSETPGGRPLEIWAVQATPAAAALARRTGLHAVRELLIMRRSLIDPIPPVPPPAGVEIRAFQPGRDEAEWLAVNSRAFADHPEQGGLTMVDLEQRMAEPWFDPAGFFLAVRDGRVVGFHWTKQHPADLGEVYVLGVDPAAGVRGLGRALLAAGLTWLRSAGCTAVLLYVDATNTRAVGLYEGAGFGVAGRDVMYAGRNARAS